MMTALEKIKKQISCANGSQEVMSMDMVNELFPSIEGALKGACNKIGYDGIKYDQPADEYPKMIYSLLYLTVRPSVLTWLKRNKPEAWFLPMYMSKEEQDQLMAKS